MRDHIDDHIDGDTHGGRARSGAVLSIVPADGGAHVPSRTHHPAGRRRAPGPRPVRPVAVGARPATRPAPVRTAPRAPERQGAGRVREPQRVLQRRRRPASGPLALRFRVRRAVAGAVAVLVTAAVVVGLGMLADTASVARRAAPVTASAGVPAEIVVTVGPGETLGQIVRRALPSAGGADLTAAVERTVTRNSLTSVQVRPGQVLHVPVS